MDVSHGGYFYSGLNCLATVGLFPADPKIELGICFEICFYLFASDLLALMCYKVANS